MRNRRLRVAVSSDFFCRHFTFRPMRSRSAACIHNSRAACNAANFLTPMPCAKIGRSFRYAIMQNMHAEVRNASAAHQRARLETVTPPESAPCRIAIYQIANDRNG